MYPKMRVISQESFENEKDTDYHIPQGNDTWGKNWLK